MFKRIFEITGNVAIVTGCSTGLGVQMAHALANPGCTIVAIARRYDKLLEVCKEIEEQHGVETMPIKCDITDTAEVEATVKQVVDRYGRVDILVNNAGTGAVEQAENITDEQFQKEFDVDLFSPSTENIPFLLCRQIVRDMGEATNARGCGITTIKSDKGYATLVVTLAKGK